MILASFFLLTHFSSFYRFRFVLYSFSSLSFFLLSVSLSLSFSFFGCLLTSSVLFVFLFLIQFFGSYRFFLRWLPFFLTVFIASYSFCFLLSLQFLFSSLITFFLLFAPFGFRPDSFFLFSFSAFNLFLFFLLGFC